MPLPVHSCLLLFFAVRVQDELFFLHATHQSYASWEVCPCEHVFRMLVYVLHEVSGSNRSAAELKTLLGNHLPKFFTPFTLLKVGVAVTINQPIRRMLLNLNLWFYANANFFHLTWICWSKLPRGGGASELSQARYGEGIQLFINKSGTGILHHNLHHISSNADMAFPHYFCCAMARRANIWMIFINCDWHWNHNKDARMPSSHTMSEIAPTLPQILWQVPHMGSLRIAKNSSNN